MRSLDINSALLVIDMQKGFEDSRWGRRNNNSMDDRVAEILDTWRARRRRVVHIKHMSTEPYSPLRPGQPGNDFKSRMIPRSDELVVQKTVNSGFIGTGLEQILRACSCSKLVLVGLTTNHCVSTTARMAGNLGFATSVVSDATATFDRFGPDGINYSAEQIHAIALSDLHGEFADVVDTISVLTMLNDTD